MRILLIIGFMLVLASCKEVKIDKDFHYVYLTYSSENTANEITINVATTKDWKEAHLYLRKVGEQDLIIESKRPENYPFLKGASLFRFKLKDLSAATSYSFRFVDRDEFGKEFKFKTLADKLEEVSFVVGGDTGTDDHFKEMTSVAASLKPDFAVLGGDIAYANGNPENWGKWYKWFKIWTERMVTEDGYLIPMIVAIGNHETNYNLFNSKFKRAPFYYTLFAQSELNTNFKRVVAENIHLYILDTGHITNQTKQRPWLQKDLKAREANDVKFAFYHIPMYPSNRSYNSIISSHTRNAWAGTFEKYHIDGAFEHHDHLMKRTKPIRNGEVVSEDEGVVYFGDGSWGKNPRTANPARWYLETAQEVNHVWQVTVKPHEIIYRAIGKENVLHHEYVRHRSNKSLN